jgi:hypothetical protein
VGETSRCSSIKERSPFGLFSLFLYDSGVPSDKSTKTTTTKKGEEEMIKRQQKPKEKRE